MKYCTKLFEEINFEPSSLQPCCNIRKMKIPTFPYHGGPVDMTAYVDHLQKICDELQKRETALCKGCPELHTQKGIIERDVQFKAVTINMHRFFCNCKCNYCSLWKHSEKGIPYSILPGLRSLHEGGFLDKYCAISWGGGEPSILPEFNETVMWAADNLYWQYIHTNAIKFSSAIAALLNMGLGHINVSLDSGSATQYKMVKGVDAWDKVINNLRQYSKLGKPGSMTLKYIVFSDNNRIGEIEKFLLLCNELKVNEINYSLNFNETNAERVDEKTILGAAFLKKRAQELGINPVPFYLDKHWLTRIDEVSSQL